MKTQIINISGYCFEVGIVNDYPNPLDKSSEAVCRLGIFTTNEKSCYHIIIVLADNSMHICSNKRPPQSITSDVILNQLS